MHTERKKNLPENSLQQIKYVGDVYEKKFKGAGISTISALRSQMSRKSTLEIERFLKRIFTRKGGALDQRAYNSTTAHLYRHGNGSVPRCSKIRA